MTDSKPLAMHRVAIIGKSRVHTRGLGRPDKPRPRSRRSPLRTRTRQGLCARRRPERACAAHANTALGRGDGGWEENAAGIAEAENESSRAAISRADYAMLARRGVDAVTGF